MAEHTIIPVEQRTIDFHGDTLVAVQDEQGTVWVPIRRLCEALGVAYRAQLARIERDPVLIEEVRSMSVTHADGRTFEMTCLPLKYVRAWLFGINATRVKEELRDKLIQYQREVIEIIDRAFSRPLPPDGLNEAMIQTMIDNAIQQAEVWKTILSEQRRLRAAEEFLMEVDDRLSDHDRALQRHEQALAELHALQASQSQLLAQITTTVRLLPAPSDTITPAQQATITGLVNDLAAAAQSRGQRLGQGRSDHAAVWATLKRRFNVARYQDLTQAQFGQVVAWLETWLTRVRGTE